MNNEEPKKLSDYLRTEKGMAVLKRLNDELERIGEKPAKETGYRYSLLSEAMYFLVGECADAEPGSEYFDVDVDEGLFKENVDAVVASVLGHLYNDDFNCNILGAQDARYDALCDLWRDYRA